MPDIQTLTSLVQQLDAAAGWWSNKALWFVAFTAIAAAGYLVTSLMASDRATQLKNAQAQLIKAKDDQLTGDLKSKDVSISAADQKAASAKKETARLTKEAEQAKTERAEANKQIEIAKADAARAKEGIANAEAVSAKAGAEVARLQVVVANAEQKRAEAEKALLELQERVKPRHLTTEQRAKLITFLKANPKGTVTLVSQSNDAEAYTFARELAEAFIESGWTVAAVNQAALIQFRPGLILGVHDRENPPPNSGFLQRGLDSVGFPVEGVVDPDQVPAGTLLLVVGPKP